MKTKIYLIKVYLALTALTFGSLTISKYILPFKHSFPYVSDFLSKQGSWLFWPLGNFDGVHYLLLAKDGYVRDLYQAFFPVYPWLIKKLGDLIGSYLASGLILSHICFLTALYYFYKLLKLDYNTKITRKIILLFAFFPTSFYFLSVYTESIFLALVFGFFYYLRQKKYWLAALLAGLASATRLIGIFLFVSFLIERWPGLKKFSAKKTAVFAAQALISLSGWLLYMRFLNSRFDDPLKFMHVQQAFGASRTPERLILLYQVFFRYFKMFLTVDPASFLFFTIQLEFWFTLIFLFALIMAFFKKFKVRTSYAVFSLFAFMLPTLTGTLSSMPRYVLTCFAGFIVLAQIGKDKFYKFMIVLSIMLLFVASIMFFRGYWVA